MSQAARPARDAEAKKRRVLGQMNQCCVHVSFFLGSWGVQPDAFLNSVGRPKNERQSLLTS